MQKSPRQKMGGKKLSLEKHKSRVNQSLNKTELGKQRLQNELFEHQMKNRSNKHTS